MNKVIGVLLIAIMIITFSCCMWSSATYQRMNKVNETNRILTEELTIEQERNEFLTNKNIELDEKNIKLSTENEELLDEINTLTIENEDLYLDNKQLLEEVAALENGKEYMSESDRDFLAKLLFCEVGGEDWDCQLYTCSAILNLRDRSGRSLWEMGHDYNTFEVAKYVDGATPNDMQYEIIDFVLSGGRVPEICYFRTNYYHSFGTPVCQVGAHYFSKP